MIEILKNLYRKLRFVYHRMKFYYSINWTKTLYFNFKKFPVSIAKKLPVFFYGKVKFHGIKGEIIINAPVKTGMIGFGQLYETTSRSAGTAFFCLEGKIVFKGHVQFGKDYLVSILKNAYFEMGHMASLGSNGKIICTNSIIMGTYTRVGFESQIIDTNGHGMIHTLSGEKYPISSEIILGSYNFIGNRNSIMQKTITPNYCTITSNSLCNKDYSYLGENILIGGIPAKLIKTNISRDWDGEREDLEKHLII